MTKKILFHTVFWILAWIITLLEFGYSDLLNPASQLYCDMILVIAAGVSYCIAYFLIPGYLSTGKYFLFTSYLLFMVIISLDLELVITMVFIMTMEKYEVAVFFRDAGDVYSLLTGTYFIVFLFVAIKLAEYWFTEQRHKQEALREKVETELKLLKSQIHPHFLFNTLNNIYSLSLVKSDRAPDAVLKLSEMLDFLIYRSEEDKLPLKRETDLIRNYIELEQLRYGESLHVAFNINGDPEKVMLAPLLILPLVENAFKHGLSRSRSKKELKIKLDISGGIVDFYIRNSVPENSYETGGGGIGLNNLKKRLELLYEGRHSLRIEEGELHYSVSLRIET